MICNGSFFGSIRFILCISALFLSSCTTKNKITSSVPIVKEVSIDRITADISVNESKKLQGTSKVTYLFGIFRWGDKYYVEGMNINTNVLVGRINSKLRSVAVYKALRDGNYDTLIHPTFESRTKHFLIGRTFTVTVTGYGAKYSNFRTEKQKIVITGFGEEYVVQDN